ncbi:MAG TPA: S41 family peptidase, partial [Puia sp.]
VNGLPASVLLYRLMARQIRDGYNTTYPKWILNQYFGAYYSFVFGRPEEFVMDFKTASGEGYQRRVRALSKDSIAYFQRSRYGAEELWGRGIVLEEKGGGTAVLTIRSFNPDILSSTYGQEYRQTIDSLFRLLELHKVSNLILDVRNNQGGDFPPMRYLLSYLVLRPVRCILGGEESRMVKPAAHCYKGKLWVLINGGSYSATAITAAVLQKEGRARFIGEETGGNKYEISGNPEELILPRTKIRCYIATVIYKITSGKNNGHGVYPDYFVAPEAEDIEKKKDRPMEMAMRLIQDRAGSF